MIGKIIKKFLVDVLLEKAEEKFINFLKKVFTDSNVEYFSKIKNTVNDTMKKIMDAYNYLEPMIDEIKHMAFVEDNKVYLQGVVDFIEKEFAIKLTMENIIEAAEYIDSGAWKRETSVSVIKKILEELHIEVKESLIRASLEMAYQAFKTEKATSK